MAEITRRRAGEMLRRVFEVLLSHTEGLPARTVIEKVKQGLPPSEYESGIYESGVQRFEKILRFHTIATVKAGWLVKTKGVWSLTDHGRRAYDRHKDPEEFAREAGRLYREWAKSQPEQPAETITETQIQTQSSMEEAEEAAWAAIETHLQNMPPYDFQNLVAALLRAMGYHVAWVAPPGRDGGLDIVAYSDPLGTRPPRIKVQVKRRAEKVGVDGLRSFLGVVGDQEVGIFVSTGGFTADAEAEGRTQDKRRVTLLGLEQIFDLWVEHYRKIAESDRQLLPLKPIYFLAPDE